MMVAGGTGMLSHRDSARLFELAGDLTAPDLDGRFDFAPDRMLDGVEALRPDHLRSGGR